MALRAAPDAAAESEEEAEEMPGWAPAVGCVAAAVGAVSVAWCLAARPGA